MLDEYEEQGVQHVDLHTIMPINLNVDYPFPQEVVMTDQDSSITHEYCVEMFQPKFRLCYFHVVVS
jgi:hypothetical protein